MPKPTLKQRILRQPTKSYVAEAEGLSISGVNYPYYTYAQAGITSNSSLPTRSSHAHTRRPEYYSAYKEMAAAAGVDVTHTLTISGQPEEDANGDIVDALMSGNHCYHDSYPKTAMKSRKKRHRPLQQQRVVARNAEGGNVVNAWKPLPSIIEFPSMEAKSKGSTLTNPMPEQEQEQQYEQLPQAAPQLAGHGSARPNAGFYVNDNDRGDTFAISFAMSDKISGEHQSHHIVDGCQMEEETPAHVQARSRSTSQGEGESDRHLPNPPRLYAGNDKTIHNSFCPPAFPFTCANTVIESLSGSSVHPTTFHQQLPDPQHQHEISSLGSFPQHSLNPSPSLPDVTPCREIPPTSQSDAPTPALIEPCPSPRPLGSSPAAVPFWLPSVSPAASSPSSVSSALGSDSDSTAYFTPPGTPAAVSSSTLNEDHVSQALDQARSDINNVTADTACSTENDNDTMFSGRAYPYAHTHKTRLTGGGGKGVLTSTSMTIAASTLVLPPVPITASLLSDEMTARLLSQSHASQSQSQEQQGQSDSHTPAFEQPTPTPTPTPSVSLPAVTLHGAGLQELLSLELGFSRSDGEGDDEDDGVTMYSWYSGARSNVSSVSDGDVSGLTHLTVPSSKSSGSGSVKSFGSAGGKEKNEEGELKYLETGTGPSETRPSLSESLPLGSGVDGASRYPSTGMVLPSASASTSGPSSSSSSVPSLPPSLESSTPVKTPTVTATASSTTSSKSKLTKKKSSSTAAATPPSLFKGAKWAKDVRWLVPLDSSDWKGYSFHSSSSLPSITASSSSQTSRSVLHDRGTTDGLGSGRGKRRHRHRSSISESKLLEKMSFILEEVEEEAGEDEGSESGGSGSGNSASTGRTVGSANSGPSSETLHVPSQVQQRPTPMSALSRARTASAPTDALSMRTASGSGSGSILRRGYVAGTGSRTASIYSGVSGTSSSRHSFNSYQTSGRRVLIPSPLPGINGQSHILSASSASLPTRSSTPHSSLPNGSLTASSVYSPSAFGGIYRAYSSLVLPRAAFTPSKHPDRVSSQIDITKSGLAQTSMATVEVRRGAAEALLRGSVGSGGTKGGLVGLTRLSVFGGLGSLNGKGNRMSGLFSSSSSGGGIRGRTMKIGGGGSGGRASRSLEMPGHLREKLKMDSPSPLAFSVHTPPPNKLTSGQVLVQVFMVGLDWLDALVVKEKVEGSGGGDVGGGRGEGCGFVPGRSFVGRTVEVGFEVRNVCKGDWVFGLLDLGKCGALAEFIIVDRRRVHRAPNLMHSDLHLEQVASLPLSGVPTHRAIRTLPNVVKGKKALVLNAHDGAGALMVQVLCSHEVIVTAQVPAGSGVGLRALGSVQNGRGGKGNATSSSKSEGHQVEEVEQSEDEEEGEKISTFEERAKMFGASRVMVGDPLVVIAECKEGEFDYVLDTVGGKRIWEASGWVLKSGGQFTTLVGDAPDIVPYTSSNFKSNLRSIQGALKRKKGYEWVMPNAELDTEGEDVRDALGSVAKMAEAGLMVPWCKQGVKFERTADVFGEGVSARLFEGGGVVVSKIIG